MSDNYTIEVEITPKAYKLLDQIAQERRTVPSSLISEMIIDFINNHFHQKKTQFRDQGGD